MKSIFFKLSILFSIAIFSAGCATTQPQSKTEVVATEKSYCIGQIDPMPPGLIEVNDSELLQSALGEPGKGGLCKGKVYRAIKPVTVYRVWNSAKGYSKYGRWWSFEKPKGPRGQYRLKNAICPSWSELNMLSQCEVKVGEKIVVGPGQSAQCLNWKYPVSATNQVFIDNDSRNNQLKVQSCTAGIVWPVNQ